MGSKQSSNARKSIDNARVTGTQKYCRTQPSILIRGTSHTPTQVETIYRNDLDAMAAVQKAELALPEARASAKAVALVRNSFDKGFVAAIKGAYGNSPSTLGTFGIASAPPQIPTTAVKAAAVVKREATRAIRHTMGPKQKAKLSAAATQSPSAAATADTTPSASPTATGVDLPTTAVSSVTKS